MSIVASTGQSAAASSWAARLISTSSRSGAATSWTPIGRPSVVRPSGRLIAGWPVTFQIRTSALKRLASSVTPGRRADAADRRRQPGKRRRDQHHVVASPTVDHLPGEPEQLLASLQVVDQRHPRRIDQPCPGRRLELVGVDASAVQTLDDPDQVLAGAGHERAPSGRERLILPAEIDLLDLVTERLPAACPPRAPPPPAQRRPRSRAERSRTPAPAAGRGRPLPAPRTSRGGAHARCRSPDS